MDLLAFFIPGLFAVEENLSPKEALYAAIILAVFFIWFLIACKPWQKTPEEKQKKRKNRENRAWGPEWASKDCYENKDPKCPYCGYVQITYLRTWGSGGNQYKKRHRKSDGVVVHPSECRTCPKCDKRRGHTYGEYAILVLCWGTAIGFASYVIYILIELNY